MSEPHALVTRDGHIITITILIIIVIVTILLQGLTGIISQGLQLGVRIDVGHIGSRLVASITDFQLLASHVHHATS